MKRLPITNQQGFTLVEAFVAMLILSVGLLAVGLMQLGAVKGNTNASGRNDAIAVAQSVMDTLRSTPLDDTLLNDNASALDAGRAIGGGAQPIPANADHTATELYGVNPVPGMNGRLYTIFWNVVDDSPVDNAKTVRLFVYWTDPKFGVNRVIVTSVMGGLYL